MSRGPRLKCVAINEWHRKNRKLDDFEWETLVGHWRSAVRAVDITGKTEREVLGDVYTMFRSNSHCFLPKIFSRNLGMMFHNIPDEWRAMLLNMISERYAFEHDNKEDDLRILIAEMKCDITNADKLNNSVAHQKLKAERKDA